MASGRGHRLLRSDRARLRLQPGRDDHDGAGDEGRLGAEWREDVDHQRVNGHSRGGVGQDRTGRRSRVDPRVPRADRHAGVLRQGSEGQTLACARATRASSCSRTCACPGTRCFPNSGGLKAPLCCLTAGALRHRLGRGGRGDGVLRRGASSYAKARVMFGKPIGGFQIQQARLADMLTEITKAQLLCAPARPAQGPGHDDPAAGVAGQAQQRGHGHRRRPRSAAPARRQRHPGRVPG